MKIDGLFVSHEGVGDSIYHSQVVEHCQSMEGAGYRFDVLTFDPYSKTRWKSVKNLELLRRKTNTKITLKYAVNTHLPFSLILNLFFFYRAYRRLYPARRYKFIHARADYSAFICLVLRRVHKLPVVWDVRGDSVDELCLAIDSLPKIFRPAALFFLVRWQQKMISYIRDHCAGGIFVSHALHLKHKLSQSKPTCIIPCPVPEEKFFFDLQLRQKWRGMLGFGDHETVFIYSGSMTRYQGFQEFQSYYFDLARKSGYRLIIATTEVEKANRIFEASGVSGVQILNVGYEEMNGLYCAADYGVLIRADRFLNRAASPTKFGEYCLTGLPVVHNAVISQVNEICAALGNGLSTEILPRANCSNQERQRISNEARKFYSRKWAREEYNRFYRAVMTK